MGVWVGGFMRRSLSSHRLPHPRPFGGRFTSQGRFDDATKALEAAATAQAGVESRLAAAEDALAKKDEALTAAKGLNEGMEKNANGLRTNVCVYGPSGGSGGGRNKCPIVTFTRARLRSCGSSRPNTTRW